MSLLDTPTREPKVGLWLGAWAAVTIGLAFAIAGWLDWKNAQDARRYGDFVGGYVGLDGRLKDVEAHHPAPPKGPPPVQA